MITISEAQEYFDTRLGTKMWDTSSDADKTKAIAMATRSINNLEFKGDKTNALQTNEFPRDGDIEIPDPIRYAICELALQFLSGADLNKMAENQAVVSRGYSSVKTVYDRSFIQAHIQNGIPSVEAWQYLLPYLTNPLGVNLSRSS